MVFRHEMDYVVKLRCDRNWNVIWEYGIVGCGKEGDETCDIKERNICKGWDGRFVQLENKLEGLKKSKENRKLLLLKIAWH